MEEINIEVRDRYYKELEHRLCGEDFATEPIKDGLLPVRWQGAPICRVTAGGGAQFRDAELDREGGRAAFDHAVDIAREVMQYMQLMDAAPVLKAEGLDENYKLLADFGGAVLAGHPPRVASSSSLGSGPMDAPAYGRDTTLKTNTPTPSATSA